MYTINNSNQQQLKRSSIMRHQIKPEHQARGPKPGPEGVMIGYQLMVPKSLRAWLSAKGPKYVRSQLLKMRG